MGNLTVVFDSVAKLPYWQLSRVALPTHLLNEYVIIYIRMRFALLSSAEIIYQAPSLKSIT